MPAGIANQFKGFRRPMGSNANLIFYWLGLGNFTCLWFPWQITAEALKLNANLAEKQQTQKLRGVVYHSARTSVSFGRDDGGQLTGRKSFEDKHKASTRD